MVGKEYNPQILMNLALTNVPRCIIHNVKTLGLLHLQLLKMLTNSGPPDRACIIHHTMDKLLAKQCNVSDGQAASPVKEAKDTQFLSCLSSYLAGIRHPGQLCFKG
jgi:hypothetical protein